MKNTEQHWDMFTHRHTEVHKQRQMHYRQTLCPNFLQQTHKVSRSGCGWDTDVHLRRLGCHNLSIERGFAQVHLTTISLVNGDCRTSPIDLWQFQRGGGGRRKRKWREEEEKKREEEKRRGGGIVCEQRVRVQRYHPIMYVAFHYMQGPSLHHRLYILWHSPRNVLNPNTI